MLQSEVLILRELIAGDPAPVSGQKLARLLGISRVAVWGQLQKLERQGFEFEAVHSRGYRIVKVPPGPHLALIQAHLRLRHVPHMVCLDQVDSTNAEAERRLAAGEPVPLVIIAREQTHGRGRLGRQWHSAAIGNLYATFVFRPRIEPARLQDFTLWMGLNVCELVQNFCKIQPGLKWPNDLFVDGRKAGGMLTEARVDADQVRDLVFGLGLNVNGLANTLPPEVRRTAIALGDVATQPLDLNRLVAALIGRLQTAYDNFLSGEYRDKCAELWQRYDILRGQAVTVIQGMRSARGTAMGIDDEGSLIVRLDTGKTERFRAGEVTLGKHAA
jgi:BirA family biotin operon repressor/biotin-[acetyl-CoA-carboxylase] ligase